MGVVVQVPPPQSKSEGNARQSGPSDPAAGTSGRSSAATIKQLRQARAKRLLRRLFVFVGGPTLVAIVYFSFIATDQFQSYSEFTIHSAELQASTGLEALLGGVSSATSRDVLAAREYVTSRDMLGRLDKEHSFIKHYQDPSVDWLSRLRRDATFEDAYDYFGNKVAVDFDSNTGSLKLRVRAFDPHKAVEFSQAILGYVEEMVNKLSERERNDRTQFAQAQVTEAEDRLSKARQSIITLQQKHKELNPVQTANAALSLRTQLEGELAKARAELMALQTNMQPDAPQVLAARSKVSSLAAQVAGESQRMVDSKQDGLNASLPEFDAANTEKEFAQKAYESAMAALEMARADAARQHRYLAIIATPSEPDESTYPRRFLSVLTVLVVSFLIMGVGTLVAAAVREHARL